MAIFDLHGATALITGAGRPEGIGMACAYALGELGAYVVISARGPHVHDRVGELAAAGISATAAVADLTVREEAEALVTTATGRTGRLDILINNAGMTSLGDPGTGAALDAIEDADWQHALSRNLTSVLLVSRPAVRHMRERGYGRIVNMSSVSGPVAAFPDDVAYHAAKAGVIGLTRSAAIDLAANGITVNAVAPGWIATASATAAELAHGAATPVGRSGTPTEVAALVASLCLPSAAYITGQLLIVDGGNTIAEMRGSS